MHFGKLVLLSLASTLFALPAWAGTISGRAFFDHDKSGSWTSGDEPMAGVRVHAVRAETGVSVAATAAADGTYAIGGLVDGAYTVLFDPQDWWLVRYDWVPTTTGSLQANRTLTLAGNASADFGWRKIVRSTTAGSPITSYVGPSGLRVESYDDVVSAKEVHDAVAQGLIGAEAPYTKVRFDYGTTSMCPASAAKIDGQYKNFSATVYVAYETWLDNHDVILGHEYGHAWSQYLAFIVQQDPDFTAYLQARGLYGDPRVGTSHAWAAGEMIAEDYRQLFGSPTARALAQENGAIPPAAQVPGLQDFLLNTYTQPAAGSPQPAPEPAPEPAPAPEPEPEPAATVDVQNLQVNPAVVTSSATVAFDLTAAATLTVEIRTGSGSLVRTLSQAQPALAGPQSLVWDRKNGKGRRVKAGSYQARVAAVGPDGQAVVRTQAFSVK